MEGEYRATAGIVRIALAGYNADEVLALVAQLESAPDVVQVDLMQDISASSMHDALESILADTTLIAQISEQAAKFVGSIAVVTGS